jgi:hypothetical protein
MDSGHPQHCCGDKCCDESRLTDLRVWMLMSTRTDPGVSGPKLDGVIIPSRRQYKLKIEIIY